MADQLGGIDTALRRLVVALSGNEVLLLVSVTDPGLSPDKMKRTGGCVPSEPTDSPTVGSQRAV